MTIKNDKMQTLFSVYILVMLLVENSICDQVARFGSLSSGEPNGAFFDHEVVQGSSWRTIGYEELNDPKNLFFSRVDSDEQNTLKPDGSGDRSKRQIDEQIIDAGTIKIKADIGDELSTQKQEFDSQDSLQVSTESVPPTTEIGNEENYPKTNFIPINDFIRFRRESNQKGQQKSAEPGSNSNSKSQNFEMDRENVDMQNNRGPRGLSTQEWAKFPYQARREPKSDDSFASASDFAKPRRVHFITQKQFEVENPQISSNSRQGRVVEPPRQSRDQPREPRLESDMRKGPDLFAPRFREYDPPSQYPFRFSKGRYYERDLMDRMPDSRSLDFYPRNRDRRIIYYANLPEITRESPRFREMGRYRDPFEERFSGNQYQRAFYRDRINEEPHPSKVSAEVNVREVKKNPEKRIYSDVKRKYGYDSPSFESDTLARH